MAGIDAPDGPGPRGRGRVGLGYPMAVACPAWTLGEFKVAIDGVTFTTAAGPQERSWSEVAGVHPKGRRGIRLELREGHDHVVHVPAEDRNHLVAVMGALIDRHAQDAGTGPALRTDGSPSQAIETRAGELREKERRVEMTGRPDWPDLARDVVTALRGDPAFRSPREWRWDARGSLALYLDTGSLEDFKTGEELDLLGFIIRECRLPDRRAAGQWLEAQGYPLPLATPTTEIQPSAREASAAAQVSPPFWKTDLPRLDYVAIPDDPEHPLNRWATTRCGRPEGTAWPAGCRWLRAGGAAIRSWCHWPRRRLG